jgi:predicted phosphodiesterase
MRVGIVGDLHLPFEHPHYLDFCRDTFRHWKVEHVVFIGDVVDHHALSFFVHDPDGLSASDEASEASVRLRSWQKAFPVAEVAIGNHDARCFRTAHKAGIPTRYLRDYAEVFQTPGWAWKFDFRHDGVLYEHGSSSGKYAAFNTAINKRTSLVMGHTHTHAGVLWHANQTNRIFAMQVGCGIDVDAYAFAYGRAFSVRPMLGCGIVIDGQQAVFEAMACGKRERYYRKRR